MKPLLRLAKISLIVLCCAVGAVVVIPLVGVGVQCAFLGKDNPAETGRPEPLAALSPQVQEITASVPGYRRREEQTYLTFPEWYIVYSADEYAAFLAHHTPSQFPYFQAVGQYWRSYAYVCTLTRQRYAFNTAYHLSLAVIGTSFTLENVIKGLYENTLGRVTEWLSGRALTAEDAYARQVAKEYGDFIHTIPWYEFPFAAKFSELWHHTSLWGPHGVRKWERKVALSLEYGVKAVYGWLIKRATQTTYAPEELIIHVRATGLTPEVLQRAPDVRIVTAIEAHTAIATLPRYEAFTQLVQRLARDGVQFLDIAGNRDILLTVLAPHEWVYDLPDGAWLFTMPMLTQPGYKRVAVQVPVPSLQRVLQALEHRRITIEHVYDY